ncbi:hypothetical protein FA13DRAFT_1753510 [Coprinellus micaceus]|uniref:Uncharacterized protein n=1 Tax=Coprinellus micaceus TaxID=71717 RepID=A0A4Y7TMN8_COPMI|nr:hypothetical protein FA13DRAFT_1753510 [Coprinellus micaceus]
MPAALNLSQEYDTSHRPYPQPPLDDYKASYDDLIDDYSAPYAPNARHQTFAISTPNASHRRGQSATLQKASSSSISLKHSDDTHDDPPLYPPIGSSKEKEVDTRTIWQKLIPESLACRLYLATVLVETTIDLAIEGELFLRATDPTIKRMPVYLAIFALAQYRVSSFAMALDAVYARNTLQFICLAIFNALFLLYAIIQINEVQQAMADASSGATSIPIRVLTIIIPVVISVAEIAYIALGWKIYHEFGWKVYKFLGADRRIKKLYANYQIYECLVKFDFIWLVLENNDWEYYVTCAALPLSLILLVEGHLAARHENKWMMATFMCGCVGAMIYFIYKLIKVLLGMSSDQYKLVWKSLTVFSVFAIMLLFATFAYSVIILRNFAKGLKAALARKADQGFNSQNHRRGPSTTLNRMSIN